MIEISCPHCGEMLHVPEKYAGQAGRCKHCGGAVAVPPLDGEGTSGGTRERVDNTVPPASFGHYSRAAEERWEDPAAHASAEEEPAVQAPAAEEPATFKLDDLPQEVREKYEMRRKQRRKQLLKIGALAGLVLLFALLVLPLVLGGGGGENADETEAPAVEQAPAEDPAPADVEPPSQAPENSAPDGGTQAPDAAPDAALAPASDMPVGAALRGDEVVYVGVSGNQYHAHGCPLLGDTATPLTLAEALNRGYLPCEQCAPLR